jgi:hypothetical protein
VITSPVIEVTAGGQPVLLMRPDPSPGRGSVEMLATLARARARAGAACFLPPPGDAGEMVALATSRDVPLVGRDGWRRSWFGARWALAGAVRRARERWRAAGASWLQEMYRELRRHAGNERLPSQLRWRLRERAHRAYDRSQVGSFETVRYPRLLLREPSAFALPQAAIDGARREAEACGFESGGPNVVLEAGMRPDVAAGVERLLTARGYRTVRLDGAASLRLRLFVLCAARFVICTSRDVQQLAYLTNTPSLAVNATDVFSAYPVRRDNVFLLRTALDLESGAVIPPDERLSDRYYRNLRNVGYRENTLGEVTEAVDEMIAGIEHGWKESDGQSRFRARAVAAGVALAPLVPAVAAWAPEDGFIGDGRLARVQADLSPEP